MLSDADAEWVRHYVGGVLAELGPRLSAKPAVLANPDRVLARLEVARDATIEHGWSEFHAIDEAHNELCVAINILETRSAQIATLEYEPPIAGTLQSIDFRINTESGAMAYVDVKTIAPATRDRWGQFALAQAEGWIPPQTVVTLYREWMGGEIWHDKVASRRRMLEYTLEGEDKASSIDLDESKLLLLFCSNGYHWHEDELEDFVAFYVDGAHRLDDPMAGMERHNVNAKGLKIPRRVRHFAYLERQSGAMSPRKINWRVCQPTSPLGFYAPTA